MPTLQNYESPDTPITEWSVDDLGKTYIGGSWEEYEDYISPYDPWKEDYYKDQNELRQRGIESQQNRIQEQIESARNLFGIETRTAFKSYDDSNTIRQNEKSFNDSRQGFAGSGYNQYNFDNNLSKLQDKFNTQMKTTKIQYKDKIGGLNLQSDLLNNESGMLTNELDMNITENQYAWEDKFFDRLNNINMWRNK